MNYNFNDKYALKTGLLLDRKDFNAEFIVTDIMGNETGQTDRHIILSYMTLPLLMQYTWDPSKNLFLTFGPYLGILNSAKIKIENEEGDLSDQVNSLDIGASLGIGRSKNLSDNLKISTELRYNHGFLQLNKVLDTDINTTVDRNHSLYLLLGVTYSLGEMMN